MQHIRPSVVYEQFFCVESAPTDCGFVVFGASGDLTQRKLIPALANLFKRELLPQRFFFLGCGRSKLSDGEFRQTVSHAAADILSDGVKHNAFINRFHFISGDYADKNLYNSIGRKLSEFDRQANIPSGRIFYLAVPPFLYSTVISGLGDAGLNKSNNSFVRLVVEKPFGRDLHSALELNDCITKWFNEEQIYRIDHYLGKETVQNILIFRFANSIFEPVWNRNYIDHIQITIAESIGIEARGSYYDRTGALRDMFVNHLLNMLSLVAMEPPVSFAADHIRDEKVKLLRSVRSFAIEPWNEDIVKGQYAAGTIDGRTVPAYRQEKDVDENSKTETFVAARLFIDNWRWRDVPFYLRTGKRLPRRLTEIAIIFKPLPHLMFASAGIERLPANVLVLKIQPQEGISLSFEAKRPGPKLCLGTLEMDFNYADVFEAELPEAYQRLLLDCMLGDQTLFDRIDSVKAAWQLVDNVLRTWQKKDLEPYLYPAGSESFPQADELIQKDGRNWRRIAIK